jgi:glycine/D-amino acid oxidase-like deaminating enzyme
MASETTEAQSAGNEVAPEISDAIYGSSYFAANHVATRDRPALSQDIDVDVCVVGAGLAGLTAAREVARKGWSVAVLEAKRVAWNASGRNTGFVLPGFGQDADRIVERVGLDAARELWALSQSGVDYVRETIADGDMGAMEHGDGWLHVSKTDRAAALQDDAELHRNLGADVEFWPSSLVRSKLKSETYFQAVHFPTAFAIHPLNYALGLAGLAEQAGARIFENTSVLSIDPAGVRKRISTASARVRAGHIVLAGNTHLGALMPELSRTLIPIHTYVIVTRPLGPELAEAIDYPGSVSDTDRADSHYRIVGGDRLMWAGRMTVWDAKPGRFGRRLRRDLRRRFPQLETAEVDYAWTGELGMTVHRMPQIGELSPGVWLASGFGGHGLNTTAMAGNLIARAVMEGDDRWRQFQPFELVWAGGRTGRIVMQSAYWGRREYEKWASKRARANELYRIRMEPVLKKRAEEAAERARLRAEREEVEAVARAEAARIKAEQDAETARIKAEQRAARKAEKERIAAEKAEAKRLKTERIAAEKAATEAAHREAGRVAAEVAAAAEAARIEAEHLAVEQSAVIDAEQASAEAPAESAAASAADQPEQNPEKKKRGWFGRG